MTIQPHDVAALIEAFERSTAQDMRIAAGQFELQLSKNASGVRQAWAPRADGAGVPRPAAASAPVAAPTPAPALTKSDSAVGVASLQTASATPPAGHVFVRAANLGTFYRSPKPGAPSYVDVGSRVTNDTEVCLIEVMKLFTPLVAGTKGEVREIYVNDGALVEFDQPLFLVRVDS
ncbi:MAG: acetyl-CoA carboxylase, biotin carboxyl carrier protein [Proteobacteria bacterium]|nr:acetyl-CoA carboxylase, biotin carboxyl carrier protein [Pseudomonadota bacterium]